ncbi:MAG: 2-C-methyl-D-erythritol 2,4-cyclodiphosphate synthase [SAR324 cluster bacterium]|uniref:2-C-methyl-D-erythritol 2,4-cyclodiphosphate synthase n=1 Tax=SAR324 cluster bacterium TaxID=2024889 RepID=A0A2A4SR21_9DELT|nr:MAG: 2-C-methyl-D-erythritol 2,4-cyclodiphosphate synthase [SAR324 cluster bacterium]
MRVGMGYDIHALVSGCKLVLGGIEVPHRMGLLGHSDADVLVHALMDALLGAANLGDIGVLFPDTDPEYKGISSLILLAEVYKKVREQNWKLENLDIVVMAEAPKLRPYIPRMVKKISDTMKILPDRISIKATTAERLGFIGREEGIAAQAVVLLTARKEL